MSDTRPPLPPDLSGRWACFQHTEGEARVMKIGALTTTTSLLSRVDIAQRDAALRVTWEILSMEVDAGTRMMRVEIPRPMVEAIDALERAGHLEPAEEGWRMVLPPAWSVVGVRLERPDDPLPDDAADPRVEDPDGDGAPGVTVRFKGLISGEAHVIQRTWSRLESHALSPERVEGGVWWGIEQKVLDASNRLLKLAPETRPINDDGRSYFTMVRVAPDATDRQVCDAARRLARA